MTATTTTESSRRELFNRVALVGTTLATGVLAPSPALAVSGMNKVNAGLQGCVCVLQWRGYNDACLPFALTL